MGRGREQGEERERERGAEKKRERRGEEEREEGRETGRGGGGEGREGEQATAVARDDEGRNRQPKEKWEERKARM